jgi:hypothetical protein
VPEPLWSHALPGRRAATLLESQHGQGHDTGAAGDDDRIHPAEPRGAAGQGDTVRLITARRGPTLHRKVVLAGGSGALGRRIAADLASLGHDVVVLTRTPRPDHPHRQVGWDGRTVGAWADELSGAVVINLAGEIVDRRPTARNIELLTRSRVEPTTALARAAGGVATVPPVWIQLGTVAIFGDAGETVVDESTQLDETTRPGDELPQMTGVARAWEAAAASVPADRRVLLRCAVVLDRDTPAMDRLGGLTKAGLGGKIGPGNQWFSWLHRADLLAVIRRCLTDERLSGTVHATAPHPVRNAELMAQLRRVLHRPIGIPSPAPLVRAGAVLLRTDPALALTGRRCVPTRLTELGFEFTHPELPAALDDLLG